MNETIAVAHGDGGANNSIFSPMISFTDKVQFQKNDRIDLFEKTNDNGVLYDSFYYSYTELHRIPFDW